MKNLTFVIVIMSLLQACGNDVNNDLQSQQFPSSVSGTLEHQNNQRVYNLHIPPAYDGLTDLPLVIMLHGGSGNAKSVQGFTQMNPVADANG
ncbi:MAG: hypothetical protein GVY07_05960, partial [Bacteroidetes bacterium]|nr:hypothetical protein [Bacteroidota bacterium]